MKTNYEAIQGAHSVLHRNYYADVRGVGDELIRAIRAGELTSWDQVSDWLHETVDGHARVIYTLEAQECLRYSDHKDAYVESFGSEDVVTGDGVINWSALAYSAFEADILEYVDFQGVDVHNPTANETDEPA